MVINLPQYAILATHTPDMCPLSNKIVRETAKKAYEQLPGLCKKYNAKILLDISLNPNHLCFMLFEAPNVEAVRNIVMSAGFGYFMEMNIHLVTPIDELLKSMDEMPTIL